MALGKKGSHFSFSEARPGKTRESRSLMPECLRYSRTADARGELRRTQEGAQSLEHGKEGENDENIVKL